MEIRNAQIVSTMLGKEDHGIMTCMIHLSFGSSRQGFGGYSLEFYGVDFIQNILEAVGVNTWEELKGKYIRTRSGGEGMGPKIYAIGHITEEKWFAPENEKPV